MHDLPAVPPQTETFSSTEVHEVNTNFVLQSVLQQLRPEVKNKIILRCDELPLVQGNKNEYTTVFTLLLHMLVAKQEEVSKLYLHIHCTRDSFSEFTTASPALYCIRFYTNLIPSADWMKNHREQIDEANLLLQKQKGSLTVNAGNNTGCLFSVSLPGKPQ